MHVHDQNIEPHALSRPQGAKHFEVRLRFLQERVNDGTVRFTPIATDDQIADVLTKPLAEFKFRKFASKLVA